MMYNFFNDILKKKSVKGFILPFTMLISTLILFITSQSMTLLTKQLFFSKLYKQSQIAYYAADDALLCAKSIDDSYLASDGLGIFPYSTTTPGLDYIDNVLSYVNTKRGTPTGDVNAITLTGLRAVKCGQSVIFDPIASDFSISPTPYQYESPSAGVEEGVTSSYSMKMDLGDGTYRCAKVTINKTQSFRQIIAQGYAVCGNPIGSVERAVVNTTVAE